MFAIAADKQPPSSVSTRRASLFGMTNSRPFTPPPLPNVFTPTGYVPSLATPLPLSLPAKPEPKAEQTRSGPMNLIEAARYIGVSKQTMAKLAENIPHLHVGRVRRFDRVVLDDAIRGRATAA